VRRKRPSRQRGPAPSARPRLSTFAYGADQFIVLSAPLPQPALHPLTPSEEEILACVARGMSNGDIARARQTSARTVANQIASLFRKTGATSRAELAQVASRRPASRP
jgi:DNA-binding NarL/FixJ family response regulator